MQFVAVKSEAQQAAAMAYRTRDLLVRQRTQTINALRAHLAEQELLRLSVLPMSAAWPQLSRATTARCLRRCGIWRDCFWTRSQA